MKIVKIKIEDIIYHYGKSTGDLGARAFLERELARAEFNLNNPYRKYKDIQNNLLIYEQE